MIEIDDMTDLEIEEFDKCVFANTELQIIIPYEDLPLFNKYHNEQFRKDIVEMFEKYKNQ
jgi:hypothetical protein